MLLINGTGNGTKYPVGMARAGASRRPGRMIAAAACSRSWFSPATTRSLGRELRLRESTTDEAEAKRILRRLTAQVDEQRHAKTNASFRAAMEAWLRTHEVEETTRAM